jgi:hypothetical protein
MNPIFVLIPYVHSIQTILALTLPFINPYQIINSFEDCFSQTICL